MRQGRPVTDPSGARPRRSVGGLEGARPRAARRWRAPALAGIFAVGCVRGLGLSNEFADARAVADGAEEVDAAIERELDEMSPHWQGLTASDDARVALVATADPAATEAADVGLALDAESIATHLREAEAAMRALGVRKAPRQKLAGPRVEALTKAYAEGRALHWQGALAEIQGWLALGRLGCAPPCTALGAGPLSQLELHVTVEGERAWLHAVVPDHADAVGRTIRHDTGKPGDPTTWVMLADVAAPGIDYIPFKRSGDPCLTRQWGRREVIEELVVMLREYRERTGYLLGVGDISHVTGGKVLDHWTHRLGVDVDLYLLDSTSTAAAGGEPAALLWHVRKPRRAGVWVRVSDGREPSGRASDPEAEVLASRLLTTLAQIAVENDHIAYFVHDDTSALAAFDRQAARRRPGRRFLHKDNHGLWPAHPDHAHLRWAEDDAVLPQGTPRP